MTCWGKINAKWHFISPLFWCLSVVETLIEQLWGMRCSVMFIRVKTISAKEGMIAFTLAPRRITAQTWEPKLIAAARVNACVGFIPPARFWSKPFIQRSVMPHQRLSKRHLLFEIPVVKKNVNVFVRYTTERPVPKRLGTNTCTVTPLLSNNNIKQILQRFPWL